jgi:hypothetical protein
MSCDLRPLPVPLLLRDRGEERKGAVMDNQRTTGPQAGHLFDRPLHFCPTCGSDELLPVTDRGAVHFLCDNCGRCWHVELGAVWRVNPETCAHCEHYARCSEVFAVDQRTRPEQ